MSNDFIDGVSNVKRRRRESPSDSESHNSPPQPTSATQPNPPPTQLSGATSFRSVTACNRCRLRKNRCDQRIPACTQCEKVGVKCVGYDPITKREIPRSYVSYLEERVTYLENILSANSLPFEPPTSFFPLNGQVATSPSASGIHPLSPSLSRNGVDNINEGASPSFVKPPTPVSTQHTPGIVTINPGNRPIDENTDLIKNDPTLSAISSIPVQGTSDPRFLGSTSGISFARLVFEAVKSTNGAASSIDMGNTSGGGNGNGNGSGTYTPVGRWNRRSFAQPGVFSKDTDMRDSFFGLQAKPAIPSAPFPSEVLGRKLVELYFEHSNPQIPILHRVEFMKFFEAAYDIRPGEARSPQTLYLLNIVFAIGAGIFVDRTPAPSPGIGADMKSIYEGKQQPEAYHAAAVVHLEEFLRASSGGLEELQAVLLLAAYAILRPVSPGVWYIIGVAMRLAVDLGLFTEEVVPKGVGDDGMRGWRRDLRRRLFWCTYSLDRLVSTCVGRPVQIADEVIGIEFPSFLPDEFITPMGIKQPSTPPAATYKSISYAYFQLRLLQSEILQVHHYQQTHNHPNSLPQHVHPTGLNLVTPFLKPHQSLLEWRNSVDGRLREWFEGCPKTKEATGCAFSLEFLELNYWLTLMMLYRPSLSVPDLLAEKFGTNIDPTGKIKVDGLENRQRDKVRDKEEEERVYGVVAEAGMKVLRLYRQLHRMRQVNHTFLAVHHLFMAGISFLYAIWHSPTVRAKLSMDDVDFTILAATSVLGDLSDRCPPAEACRVSFERMSRATVTMCLSGAEPQNLNLSKDAPSPPPDEIKPYSSKPEDEKRPATKRKRQHNFDHQFRELFAGNEDVLSQGTGAGKIPRGSKVGKSQRLVDRGFHAVIKEKPIDDPANEGEEEVEDEESRRAAAAEGMLAASGGSFSPGTRAYSIVDGMTPGDDESLISSTNSYLAATGAGTGLPTSASQAGDSLMSGVDVDNDDWTAGYNGLSEFGMEAAASNAANAAANAASGFGGLDGGSGWGGPFDLNMNYGGWGVGGLDGSWTNDNRQMELFDSFFFGGPGL
ncbi:Fungal specific transcription factor [Arthrobotrys conoides]|uniref:Fungal specific transcription factor n=1 Tax=Arthrobotrys conoides TaxID=74498 RepID=A0AAN8RW87_9PEZI